jgi:hypothetical protein
MARMGIVGAGARSRPVRTLIVALAVGIATGLTATPALAQDDDIPVVFGPRTSLPKATCQPGDRPEQDLQGRVAPAAMLGVVAQGGYLCNLEVVGHVPATGFVGLEGFEHCAYYSLAPGAGGVIVLDVSDPANPVVTDTLQTPGAQDTGESMRVNGKRKLLVTGNYQTNGYLDVYDLSGDCAHPKLISTTDMSPALGHEGWLSPDGSTYYMSKTGNPGEKTLFPVDISDPARPRQLAGWAFRAQTHGGFTTEDGTRSYVCQQWSPPLDALLVVDTAQVAAREPDPQPTLLHEEKLGDNQWCQGAYRVTYHGHPYLIQYGERSGAPDCSRSADNWATFAYPRIFDLADERKPRLVATAMLESSLPEHCPTVQGDLLAINGFGYSVHHCSPDRLYDPTILACSWFSAGLRIIDIRDPLRPRELAYFNPGTTFPANSASRVVVRTDRREIWVGSVQHGFYVMGFADGVWPFASSAPCPEYDDYLFAQYNEKSTCPTAGYAGIGKPAPGGIGPAPPPRAGKLTPRLSLTVRRRGSRYRVSGRLDPRGAANACRGRVTLSARRGGRTVLTRGVAVRSTCGYAARFNSRRKLTFVARFQGNAKLRPVSRR